MSNKKNSPINYNYSELKLKPCEIISNWKYNGTDELEERISYFRENDDRLLDLINQIVLWKVSRQVFMGNDLAKEIVNFEERDIIGKENINEEWKKSVCDLIVRMLKCKGIKLPMASTILHFFHPSTFLIIDQRAYRVIYQREIEYPNNLLAQAELYVDYLEKCVKYYKDNNFSSEFTFDKLDRYTYQLDKEIGNPVK